jgi:uncharacterized protein (DUF1810 family)
MNLERFVEAQEKLYEKTTTKTYDLALSEIRNGKKSKHWIWFIFPQLKGFGQSYHSNFYGIKSLSEAEAFLQHPVLGTRLIEISHALFALNETDPEKVLGDGDHKKLCSSMTLFSQVKGAHPIFRDVLEKYFSGKMDNETLKKLVKPV